MYTKIMITRSVLRSPELQKESTNTHNLQSGASHAERFAGNVSFVDSQFEALAGDLRSTASIFWRISLKFHLELRINHQNTKQMVSFLRREH